MRFLGKADEYFTSQGMKRPVRASTGRGSHLLLPYPPIPVPECPDIRERLRAIKHDFTRAHQQDLNRLEARVDSTQDLRRMVRVYGTAKPDVGVISRFYGPTRRDSDNALREHLLRMTIVPTLPAKLTNEPIVAGAIPDWFNGMLTVHASLQQALARTRKARRDEPVP